MAVNVVTEDIEENNTSKHEPAATEDIRIENLIILQTIGAGTEGNVKKLCNINNYFCSSPFSP